MTNVRQLNQDNVLGLEDDDLSPSAFGSRKTGESMEIEDEQHVSPKKKSLMPLVAGIVIALGIVGFFGWKIAAPYFNHGATTNNEAFTPIGATPKPFEPTPPNAAPTGEPVTGQSMPAPALNLPPLSVPQNAASGVPSPQIVAQSTQTFSLPKPADPAASAPNAVQALPASKQLVGQVSSPAMPEKAALSAGPSAEDIAQIHKRIDGIAAALDVLKETVAKMNQQLQTKPVSASHVVATTKTVSAPAKPKQVVMVKKPAPPIVALSAPKKDAAKVEKTDAVKLSDVPAAGMQLQAVLQDRAWFKTPTGETITVSPGEELKGVGIVQQIDADSGRVVFTNGQVYR